MRAPAALRSALSGLDHGRATPAAAWAAATSPMQPHQRNLTNTDGRVTVALAGRRGQGRAGDPEAKPLPVALFGPAGPLARGA